MATPQLEFKQDISAEKSSSDTSVVSVLENLYGDDNTIDPVYQAKAKLLNHAMQEIGMGRYQYMMFLVAGFGYFADSVWPLVTGLILAPVVNEFHFTAPFLSLAANIGLLVGAMFWGLGCDIWGRRWSFNLTLLIAGIFGFAAAGALNFVTLASLISVLGVGVGGNLPVDSAVFLDIIPGSHQYLLTILAVWWCLGQLFVSLVAWAFIANFSCAEGATICHRTDNMGWRYLLITLGAITLVMWGLRFMFPFFESPRFLVGIGKDKEAVEVIHSIARYNSTSSSLSVEKLENAGGEPAQPERKLLNKPSVLGLSQVKALFATPKMAVSTTLLISVWAIIGLGSTLYNNFLPFLLASRGAHFGDASLSMAYRNQVILSVVGIPALLGAGWAVEVPYIGRKGTLAISAGLSGAFLLASTTARSSNALLGWNCGYAFNSNIMYGVLYAISPEIFPAKYRGTGNGLVSTASRILGVVAPIIALFANLETAVPVYIAGALVIFAGGLALLIPYEPRGRASI